MVVLQCDVEGWLHTSHSITTLSITINPDNTQGTQKRTLMGGKIENGLVRDPRTSQNCRSSVWLPTPNYNRRHTGTMSLNSQLTNRKLCRCLSLSPDQQVALFQHQRRREHQQRRSAGSLQQRKCFCSSLSLSLQARHYGRPTKQAPRWEILFIPTSQELISYCD